MLEATTKNPLLNQGVMVQGSPLSNADLQHAI